MDKRKKVILHDLPDDMAKKLFATLADDYLIINANEKAAKCVGCFECWLKTPGVCKFADKFQTVGQAILSSEKLMIVSEMLYGGLSIPVKRLIDRSIPGITPFFKKKRGQLHHLQRYKSETEIKAVFYGTEDFSEEEKLQAIHYIEAMGLNFYSKQNEVIFAKFDDLGEVKI